MGDKLPAVSEGKALGQCLLGVARAELGHEAEGIALIHQGLTLMAEVANHWTTRLS